MDSDRVQGNVQWAKGVATELVGDLLNDDQRKVAGQADQAAGETKVDAVKAAERSAAIKESLLGTAKSAAGMVTGNQELQFEGNKQVQAAENKRLLNSDDLGEDLPSDWATGKEILKGKGETLQGYVTGDQNKQTQGNLRQAQAQGEDSADTMLENVANKALGAYDSVEKAVSPSK